ncbi:MAG TPA: hypothetical protein PKA54_08345 [Chitinophagaceae bacterium]|nr:hypothetical protein [Chitinophagaceae bacterium]
MIENNFLKAHLADVIVTFKDTVIHLLAYTVAYDFLKSKRIKLLNYFKDLYKNETINVIIEERKYEVEEGNQKVLSNSEIFEQMSLKNPLLKQLKQKLGMDFDL